MGARIDFLRRSCFARGAVAVQLRGNAGTVEHDALHHAAHFCRCHAWR